MNANMESIFNTFYRREIFSKDQLLNEVLRVKRIYELAKDKSFSDVEELFQFMKINTENDFGFFPGDRDFFINIYHFSIDIDIIDFTLEVYKNDRTGVIISPEYLTQYISNFIEEKQPKTILITEAEKHLSGLRFLVKKFTDKEFTFTTAINRMYQMLSRSFQEFSNVKIINQSIYQELDIKQDFDLVYCLPSFGSKIEEFSTKYITNQTDGVAIENLLNFIKADASLIAILPAKFTFSGGSYNVLRDYIIKNYNVDSIYILPEWTFRPYSSIRTYMISFSAVRKESLDIGTLDLTGGSIRLIKQKQILRDELLNHEDWRIEILLSDENENIRRYKSSNLKKVKLKEIAEVFRGKSILKKDVSSGKIAVLNISNIEDGMINYDEMDTIDEEERKIKRYELINKDLVLTCRGTSIKTAVFMEQKNVVIASANIIVIRPKGEILSEYIKLFFESPIGTTLIKSFQRGTTIMNINHLDIAEIEIPVISLEEQNQIIEKYNNECASYQETIKKAELRWQSVKNLLYERMY